MDPGPRRGPDRAMIDKQNKWKSPPNGYKTVEELKTRLSKMIECINDVHRTFVVFSDRYKTTKFDHYQIDSRYQIKIKARDAIRREFGEIDQTIMHTKGHGLRTYQQNLLDLWRKLDAVLFFNKGPDEPGLRGMDWTPTHSMVFTSKMWRSYDVILQDCLRFAHGIGNLKWMPSRDFEARVNQFAEHISREHYAYHQSCIFLSNSIKSVLQSSNGGRVGT